MLPFGRVLSHDINLNKLIAAICRIDVNYVLM
jgi:hypothetical protein